MGQNMVFGSSFITYNIYNLYIFIYNICTHIDYIGKNMKINLSCLNSPTVLYVKSVYPEFCMFMTIFFTRL